MSFNQVSSHNSKSVASNATKLINMHEAQNGGNADFAFTDTQLNDELSVNPMLGNSLQDHDNVPKNAFAVITVAEVNDDDSNSSRGKAEPLKTQNWIQRVAGTVIPYGGLVSNIFSLCSVTLGGAIISMPSSFAMSGLIMGAIYLIVINLLTIYTQTLLGYAISKTGCRTLEEVGDVLFGRGWGYFVGAINWISCFGTVIAYVKGASSLIYPIIELSPNAPAYLKSDSGNRLITSAIWLVLMLPVTIPKRVNSIRYVSAVGVMMLVYFAVVIIAHSSANGLKKGMRGNIKYFTSGNEAIYGLSIFVFAFMCQLVTPSVYLEQRPKPSVRQLTWASAIAMSFCTVLYILSGVFGYMDFGDKTKDSILYNFDPVHEPYVMVAYIGVLIKLCAAYAMNMLPCRNFLYFCLRWNLDTVPYWKHSLAITTMGVASLLCGLFIPSINTAFGLVGSLCGGFIGFLFPALFWMYCGNWSLKTVGIWHWLGVYLLIIAGVIAIVFGTIATVYMSFIDVEKDLNNVIK